MECGQQRTDSGQSGMSLEPDYNPYFNLGMRTEVQQLYRPDDRSPWNESAPDKSVLNLEAGSNAQECTLIIRHEPHPITKQVALHSIAIQSPLIKKVLVSTFKGLDGVNTHLKQLTFKAPFHSFYYRWQIFEKLYEDEQDEEVKNHLKLLCPIVREKVMSHIETMKGLTMNRVITFDYLWAILAPGMEVYTNIDGQDRFMELIDCRYGANMGGEFFTLECRYIDCNESSFGYVSNSVDIDEFEGVIKFIDLDVFPSHLHPDVERLVDRLHARGERFEQLNAFHHMSYSGFYTTRSSRHIRKRHVFENSRIIIDPHTFNIYSTPSPGLGSIKSETESQVNSADDQLFFDVPNVIYRATNQAFQIYRKSLESMRSMTKMTGKVGVSYFLVENVHPIRWSENAFPRLVLPHEQLSRDDGFGDTIYGKGMGFIMLLSGEPGVDKTLTAESVAEEMRQPLYIMSASELGETAVEVEEALGQVLELISKWNAILLLDECDIFLEARSTSDIRRNRLVSIFLRQLEYYRGVMFLTSNRISDFDPAFESRIHLTIHYPALDIQSRLYVWKTFIQIGDLDSRMRDKDLKTLAKLELNGRQIKNIVKTARLLCKQERVPLAMEHIQMVLQVKKGSLL
ncbi:P-loop containing nucleoside triphosphate hydrolase protein [Aspergillus minisclerotigenes]|uniref:P-loop containing nucleoside triphosphate hydrolase protein n=1 Tax=Aspergillus minisclerotigenes TaxID=656917 RepID=A0A5N6JI46_9EURO|nr:P-loop containing nucleoside triphosphate hydrolase protein [Aspergillus minisclerotigenes]